MIGYVLWMVAGVVLGVWLTPYLQAGKAWVHRHLQELDTPRDEVPTVREDDPAER
jgi:hypothetical protein